MALRPAPAPHRSPRSPSHARAAHAGQPAVGDSRGDAHHHRRPLRPAPDRSRLGIPSPDGLAIIASNFGQHRHPGWYHNLRADPEAEVVVDGVRRRVRAVEAEGEQRARIWSEGLRVYPGFDQYERRAAHRAISVFVLEPVS